MIFLIILELNVWNVMHHHFGIQIHTLVNNVRKHMYMIRRNQNVYAQKINHINKKKIVLHVRFLIIGTKIKVNVWPALKTWFSTQIQRNVAVQQTCLITTE